jgi:winged helix-turn-helix DNA-binding protein
VIDTATGATQVDPWGREIQAVYTALRVMLSVYPELAVILIVHLKKPQGKGEDRGISDVLGEWGRWCDVVVLQENDGLSLERTKLTTRKRVRRQRRIVATKAGGLLVDALDLEGGLAGAKIPPHDILEAVRANPGSTMSGLAKILGISTDTVSRYVAGLGAALVVTPGPNRSKLVNLVDLGSGVAEVRTVSDELIGHPQSTGRRDAARTPPSKEGEGVAVRHPNSDDLGARDPGLVVIPGGQATVTCHFPHDHSTAWRQSASGWYCAICSPEVAS